LFVKYFSASKHELFSRAQLVFLISQNNTRWNRLNTPVIVSFIKLCQWSPWAITRNWSVYWHWRNIYSYERCTYFAVCLFICALLCEWISPATNF